ncbi:class II fructose-bisphosphate aldolase [Cryobacterium sp. Y82]|uniref:class II fructose-bisphosphate aldolase n=1 Tax=Cryobacterium sp. Y82 TaxID=2045017 RepID=UPI000CE3568C|nr:class II fructose-bisphosphate aldolase [Cryobacterium sp. Y82]
MTLATTRDLVDRAVAGNRAVLAFNMITLEHAEAIVTGVERANSTAILQVSENAIRFHGGKFSPIIAACARIAIEATVPISIHFDHFQDLALTELAIDLAAEFGVSSIMVDAARLPYGQNIQQTCALTQRAHAQGLWVEGELGEIGGKDGPHSPFARTHPDEARDFVQKTAVDGLAVAVGSSHAMTSQNARLDMALIAELVLGVPVPLVLHGSSGVADETLVGAIAAGMRKINVGTALNVVFTREVRRFLDMNLAVTDPRKYIRKGSESMARTVTHLCTLVDAAPSH